MFCSLSIPCPLNLPLCRPKPPESYLDALAPPGTYSHPLKLSHESTMTIVSPFAYPIHPEKQKLIHTTFPTLHNNLTLYGQKFVPWTEIHAFSLVLNKYTLAAWVGERPAAIRDDPRRKCHHTLSIILSHLTRPNLHVLLRLPDVSEQRTSMQFTVCITDIPAMYRATHAPTPHSPSRILDHPDCSGGDDTSHVIIAGAIFLRFADI